MNIDEEFLELLTDDGEIKSDVSLPVADHLKDVASRIKSIFEDGKKECLVTVINVMGTEQVIEVREGAEV